jgi:hypothetical protein
MAVHHPPALSIEEDCQLMCLTNLAAKLRLLRLRREVSAPVAPIRVNHDKLIGQIAKRNLEDPATFAAESRSFVHVLNQ